MNFKIVYKSPFKFAYFENIFLIISLLILRLNCDSNIEAKWTNANSKNVSKGYETTSSKIPDHWRRLSHSREAGVSNFNKDAPFAYHTFVTVRDPSEKDNNNKSRGENDHNGKTRQNKLYRYSEEDGNHVKSDRSSFYDPKKSKKNFRLLHDRRSFLPHSSNRRKHKINTSKSSKDTKHFQSNVNHKYGNDKQRFKLKEKLGNRKKKFHWKNNKHNNLLDSDFEPILGYSKYLNSYSPSRGRLHERQILDRSHFLPFFGIPKLHPDDDESSHVESERDFNVPPIHTVPKASMLTRKRPNIILIMTDDLDVELGSLNYMPRLRKRMGDDGALFPNAYTTTPMCCPSRSSMLTGMYIHNHQVFTNHQNCSSPLWQRTHERRSFASYLNNAGYKTAYIGKYLNRYNGSHVPHGWREWAALLMNSRYYNYTVIKNNQFIKYGNRYPNDYYPHVITNDAVKFLKTSSEEESFLLVLSYPSPHGPEDSAPEHSHKYFNASDHHTASYNYAPNPDKQWMLQFTDRMPDIQLKYSDLLMTKRLQTLQSVDEAIDKILDTLKEVGEENNTYVFFTSDHGYHLGQFGLAKGKSMPFEFDIKVPFFVKGPGIKPGSKLPQIALNVDLAPTFLDIAGLPRPPQMDGRSLLPVLQSSSAPEDAKYLSWRDSFLVESSGRLREEEELEKKEIRTYEREKALSMTLLKATSELKDGDSSSSTDNKQGSVSLYTSKHERLEEVCKRMEFSLPCQPTQKWHCVKIGFRWKIKKCRHKSISIWQKHCICHFTQGFGTYGKLNVKERRKQRNFIRKYVTKDFHSFDSKFIKAFNNVNVPLHFGPRTRPPKSNRRKNGRKRHRRSTLSEGNSTIDDPNVMQKFEKESSHSSWNTVEVNNYEEDPQSNESPHSYLKNLEAEDSVPQDSSDEDKILVDSNSEMHGENIVSLTFHEADPSVHDFVEEEELREIKDQIVDITDEIEILKSVSHSDQDSLLPKNSSVSLESSTHGCQSSQGRIDCQDEVYANFSAWRNSKEEIEDQIHRLNKQLHVMKNILSHLQAKKPNLMDVYEEDYDSDDIINENLEDYEANIENEDYEANVENEDHEANIDNEDYESNVGKENYDSETNLKENGEEMTYEDKTLNFNLQVGKDSKKNDIEDLKHHHTDSSSSDKLNLPVVGLDIPLVEDVNYSRKKDKKQGINQKSYHDREYYFDDYSEEDDYGGGKLYYPVSLPQTEDTVLGNDSLQSRLCWCDRRVIKKMAIQEARERKRQERQKIKEKRQQRKQKRIKEKSVSCNYSTLNCYTHDNDHWRTPPLWTDGQFCFCINSANNTYWCLRTINETHNFLYCEFITGLITYYDLHIDPYQLRNVAFTLSNERVLELNEKLTNLRSCKGADECDGWVQSKKDSNVKNNEVDKENNIDIFSEESHLNNRYQNSFFNAFNKRKVKKEERERRKRLRKERKNRKAAKLHGYLSSMNESPFGSDVEIEETIRIPRKSRHKINKKSKRKEKKKKKRRKKKKERRRMARMMKKLEGENLS